MHDTIRLTDYTHGGGCACKIPPGELEDAVRGLTGQQNPNVLVGLDDGDDAAANDADRLRLGIQAAAGVAAHFSRPAALASLEGIYDEMLAG